ncbi:GNAT family protein [Flammeovirga sp. SubArs3]|uniref:GNAT family N-acetyltransferase n=1 Tax=Flammeovirga sp. SubArs3 TaxID=2995316 RepID=UPI00248BAF6C|nr:GNAT family protein [Flammeovirga sp. SubArs3]
MQKWLNKIELEGALVKLIPLKLDHKEELLNAASDGELWKLWFTSVPSINTIDKYLEKALEDYQLEKSLPFVVIDKKTNKVIGSTRFTNAVTHHKRVEIGYTWYAKSYQKTGVNTECKFLLLRHAFETLHCIAVEFRTHWHNQASRKAIARLGAKQDGVLRNHQIGEDGTLRDTVVFSIVRDEWAVTKKSLLFKLNQ